MVSGTFESGSDARTSGYPGANVIFSPRMSTTPSSYLSSFFACSIRYSSSALKWAKTRPCAAIDIPSIRLRKCFTCSFSCVIPMFVHSSHACSR